MARYAGVTQWQVRKVWQAVDVKPRRLKTFKLSRDPQFAEKVIDVVGLYLNPPDREEQFVSDCASYVHLERAGRSFDYVLITNEFDPARLVAAAERQREGNLLFTDVVHVSTDALKAVYGDGPGRSFARALAHVRSGRIESLGDWLSKLQR